MKRISLKVKTEGAKQITICKYHTQNYLYVILTFPCLTCRSVQCPVLKDHLDWDHKVRSIWTIKLNKRDTRLNKLVCFISVII